MLHGGLFLALFMTPSLLFETPSAQGGGGMMVSLATLGGTPAEADAPQGGAAPASAPATAPSEPQKASQVADTAKDSQAAASVQKVKKRPRKAKKASEEHAVEKRNVAAPKDTRQPPMPNGATPAQATDVARSGASGPGARNIASGGDGAASGSAQAGNPQLRVVPWNTQGGPRFRHQAPLRYPLAAQRQNLEGKAVVEAYLDIEGRLLRARVLQADHEVFAKAALACIQASTFQPAQQEGRAIPCLVRIPMRFVLKNF
jgi:TonB family C-terminal domain